MFSENLDLLINLHLYEIPPAMSSGKVRDFFIGRVVTQIRIIYITIFYLTLRNATMKQLRRDGKFKVRREKKC